jgi:hypothetical protein
MELLPVLLHRSWQDDNYLNTFRVVVLMILETLAAKKIKTKF